MVDSTLRFSECTEILYLFFMAKSYIKKWFSRDVNLLRNNLLTDLKIDFINYRTGQLLHLLFN